MAAYGPLEAMMANAAIDNNDGKDGADDVIDDDYTPPRDAFHTNPQLCKELIARLGSSVPLEIRSSSICTGSGLFAASANEIEAGREIYSVTLQLAAIDADETSFCHWCFTDAKAGFSRPSDSEDHGDGTVKTCTGCKTARFCSKDCQKQAWTAFHKDECKVLRKAPKMRPQHLLAHRVYFWLRRGQNALGKVHRYLENHFSEFSKNGPRITEIMDIAMAIHEETGRKGELSLVWRTVPALRINCVRLRPPTKKESVGYAFDAVTATINHSCDPNAFAYFEGRKLHVRSLKKIAAGEEITICYLDPTLDVAARRALLKHEYLFDCNCNRCRFEHEEKLSLLKPSKNLDALHQAQREIHGLLRSAMRAAKHPGIYPSYEDLPTIETNLRTIINNVFPSAPWPEHLEPLPSARLVLANLYLDQSKPIPALRNALKGKFLSIRGRAGTGTGPEWINEMTDVTTVLVVAGSLPREAAVEDKTFPSVDDIRTVTYGYLYATCREAGRVFGGLAAYTRGLCGMLTDMLRTNPGVRIGTREFRGLFEAAQRTVLAWAGVDGVDGVVLS